MVKQKEIELLKTHLKKLLKQQKMLADLSPAEFYSSNELENPNLDIEQIAKLADNYGFDGSLFRNLSPYDDFDLWMKWAVKNIQKQIDMIPRIIARIERPVDNSEIPEDVELLNIPQVARILNCGESVVRERDKKGLLPLPIRIKGAIQWRRQELLNWIEAKCPVRARWEQIITQKGGA